MSPARKARKAAPPENAAPTRHARDEEVARFTALAQEWWNPHGPMAPLHKMNPVRLDYIRAQIKAHLGRKKNIRILDIGCGAGLVSEALAKEGFEVTGLDASEKLVDAARAHAAAADVKLTYRCGEAATLVTEKKTFDVVLALEVLEHVDGQDSFIAMLQSLAAKGGLVIVSTLNRSPKGFMLGIVGAELVLRWLPFGTHDWRRFVKPSELTGWMEKAEMHVRDVCGLTYSPRTDTFRLNPRDVSVNYMVTAQV